MKLLLVHAHYEPKSFTAAMRDQAISTLEGGGHDVMGSDLYAMDFDPVAKKADFGSPYLADFDDQMHRKSRSVSERQKTAIYS